MIAGFVTNENGSSEPYDQGRTSVRHVKLVGCSQSALLNRTGFCVELQNVRAISLYYPVVILLKPLKKLFVTKRQNPDQDYRRTGI